MKNNLELWGKVCNTPKDQIETYEVEDGKVLKSTPSINRIKKATEEFGIYGKDWGLKDLKHSNIMIGNMTIAILDAIFFVDMITEFEISTSTEIAIIRDGKMTLNTSYRKSIETDLINKALSRLGFNADIYTDGELVKSKTEEEEEIMKVDFIELESKDD